MGFKSDSLIYSKVLVEKWFIYAIVFWVFNDDNFLTRFDFDEHMLGHLTRKLVNIAL